MQSTINHSGSDSSFETHWEKAAKTRMGSYLTKLELDFISKALGSPEKNIVIMDVGAEAGRFSLITLKTEATVLSLDIDPVSLRRLKQKNRQANIFLSDARRLPVNDSSLDVIFMIETMDYIPELELALSECNRALKQDGLFVVSFGNKSSFKSKVRKYQGKSYMHSYSEVVQGLFKTGFTIKRKLGYNWLPFNRISQNRLIPILAWLEWVIGLRKVPKYSPWVIIHAVKQSKQ